MESLNLNKKQLIGLATLIFLLIAIPLTIYLAQKTQIFKPKAAGESSTIEVLDATRNTEGIWEPASSNVRFRLRYGQ